MDAASSASRVTAHTSTDRDVDLGALFDAHHRRLIALALRLTGNRDDALDLVQETFVKAAAARRLPASAPEAEAYLVRVLVNTCRDQWRRQRTRRAHQAQEAPSTADSDSGPEARAVASATVWRALATLPPRRRAVLILHELDGLDTRAVAATLGVSTVTVRWHLSLGRRELARAVTTPAGGMR